jgi:hypothetical protein
MHLTILFTWLVTSEGGTNLLSPSRPRLDGNMSSYGIPCWECNRWTSAFFSGESVGSLRTHKSTTMREMVQSDRGGVAISYPSHNESVTSLTVDVSEAGQIFKYLPGSVQQR